MSDTEHTILDRLRHCLHQYLGVFGLPRNIYWTASSDDFANPGIEVGEHGLISLPLGPRDVDIIKEASPSASSNTDQNAVANNTLALDPSQFRLHSPAWQDFLDKIILTPMFEAFALNSASVKLRELLLHEPGSFIKRYQHSVTEPEIIGTIVISLPSTHKGGDIKLSFGKQIRTCQTSPESESKLVALAWLGEVSCEIEELLSGHRLVLTYDIVVPNIGMDEVLSDWRDADCGLDKAVYPLKYKYPASGLSFNALKWHDKVACQYLQRMAFKSGFSVFLARMTHHKQKIVSGSNVLARPNYTKLDQVYSCRGNPVARGLDIGEHELPSQLQDS